MVYSDALGTSRQPSLPVWLSPPTACTFGLRLSDTEPCRPIFTWTDTVRIELGAARTDNWPHEFHVSLKLLTATPMWMIDLGHRRWSKGKEGGHTAHLIYHYVETNVSHCIDSVTH